MGRKTVFTLIAILLFSALIVYAYPVAFKLTSNVGTFHTDVYKCADPACGSYSSLIASLNGNPNEYSIAGPGNQYSAEFDYKDCYLGKSFNVTTDSTTGNGPFSYDINFVKGQNCHASMYSFQASDYVVNVGDTVDFAAVMTSAYNLSKSAPYPPTTLLVPYYSFHVNSTFYVGGALKGSKVLDIPYNQEGTVNYQYKFTQPGSFLVEIYTNVDDCKCNSTVLRYKSITVNVTGFCGDNIVGSGEQCELPSTSNNQYCSQSTTSCNDATHQLGTRDSLGNCNANCGCTLDSFNYQCVKNQCGATCAANVDCNDNDPHTTDTCTASCGCTHVSNPYCGDGLLNQANEQCELPSTSNNQYCSQSTTSCNQATHQLGTRDSLGDCNSACGCTLDSFNYQCVKNQCGATCSTNADCNDGDSHTVDSCTANCSCTHICNPYCGDGLLNQASEQCELPSTSNNQYCSQSTTSCNQATHQLGTRDGLGNCNTSCGCTLDSFNYQCVKDQCGATCAANSDCNDNNPNTIDTCTATCGCTHSTNPYCGDGILNQSTEQCELPGTSNNQYCCQSTTNCNQATHQLGTRDGFGNCNTSCGCTLDSFNYQCVKNQCGATCSANSDCNDQNPLTNDVCLSDCTCIHIPTTQCGDGNVTNGEQCELPSTSNNSYCSQSNTSTCVGVKIGARDKYGDCNSLCSCTSDPFSYQCSKSCGAACVADADCPDGGTCNTNTCTCSSLPKCGDSHLDPGEQCEPKNSLNNEYCAQANISACVGVKLGTRDEFGNCNATCGCTSDSFSYQCSKSCGASCETGADCPDGKTCLQDSCTCQTCIPTGPEICDGIDNDCNGVIDDGLIEQCFSVCGSGLKICYQGNWSNCTAPSPIPTQCNGNICPNQFIGNLTAPACHTDSDCGAQICGFSVLVTPVCVNPGACDSHCAYTLTQKFEICGNGIDDNCNGLIDEDCYNCTRDSQWGPRHQFQCLEDNTFLECENNTYVHYNVCKSYCSASAACDGRVPNTSLNSCTEFGQTYLQDYCDAKCHLSDDNCESDYLGCTADQSCDESAPSTNGCTATCKKLGFCGNNITESGEQCDPVKANSAQCVQSTTDCNSTSHKLGTRDSFGDCAAGCQCTPDPLNYQCVNGQCGANCAANGDCSPSSCQVTLNDSCTGLKLKEYDSDKLLDSTTITNSTQNSCLLDSCACTNNLASCNPPQANIYCVKGLCGAECDQATNCTPTSCANLNGCRGRDYYTYADIPNSCQDSCLCQKNSCGNPTVSYNDSRCTPCQTDNDCNVLDRDYCLGTEIMHDEGKCVGFECRVNTTQTKECNDGKYCDGAESCSNANCVAGTQTDCTDGLFCTVNEHCDEILDKCVYDLKDCSANDLPAINTCDNNPDNNSLTRDYASGFTSACDESKDKCTAGNYTFTHICDKSCGADCQLGEISISGCGVSDVGECKFGHEARTCTGGCTWGGWSECTGAVYPTSEVCDGKDNNCDGIVDNNPLYTTCNSSLDCGEPSCGSGVKVVPTCLDPGTCGSRCVYSVTFVSEICGNGIDDNCNGLIDEDCYNCTRDSQWGPRHQFQCLEDNTFLECENNTYVHHNACKAYCSASAACDGRAPNTSLNSCTEFGQIYLQDYCDAKCHLADDNCESDYAGCTADKVCDELVPGTGNCSDTCKTINYCGDGTIQPNEQCELPGTSNNQYCNQSTTLCDDATHKLGTRDSLGNCNSACGCTLDTFNYQCAKGQCGAECAADADCQPKCADNVYYSSGVCNTASGCSCSYTTEDCPSHTGWYNLTTGWVSLDQCKEKEQLHQEYRSYTCSIPTGCTYTVTDSKTVDTGNTRPRQDGTGCDDGLLCTSTDQCKAGICTGTKLDCSQYNLPAIATCNNNPDNKSFTWDSASGFVSECVEAQGCTQGSYNLTHNCDKERCNAGCESNIDCANKCIGSVFYSAGTCDTASSCACSYQTQDCSVNTGWYNLTTGWVSLDQCREKEQLHQEYRSYTCSIPTGCTYTVTDSKTVDTGNTRPKQDGTECNDGLLCTTDDKCTAGVCGGTPLDCSRYNILEIATCNNNPDGNPFTFDFGAGFTSQCIEGYGCTQQNQTLTHTCDKQRCDAECLPGESDTRLCGVSNVGECRFGEQKRYCSDGCTWEAWGECTGAIYPAEDICGDNKDNDCNGVADDHCYDCILQGPNYHDNDSGWHIAPRLFLDPNSRKVTASNLNGGGPLFRPWDYAFEGEQLSWEVLVIDSNGIEKMGDTYVSVMPQGGTRDECIEANCQFLDRKDMIPGVMEGEQQITQFNPLTMRWFKCTLTVESQDSMHGQYVIQPQTVDLDGLKGGTAEIENWFLNPELSVSIDGGPGFGTLRPGTSGYNTVTVKNTAEGGVVYNLFITGTDFYDSSHSGGKCPTTNQLSLRSFRYYATNGAYSTLNDQQINSGGVIARNKDSEGYVTIEYGKYFSPALYNNAEVIQSPTKIGPYYVGNLLMGGSTLAITTRLDLPLPCNGNFNQGQIYVWAEPI